MASAKEIFRSREGGGVGVFGSQNRTTIWQVITDADGDDPVKVMWDIAGAPKEGSPFPAPDGGNKYQSWITRDDGMVAIGFNYGRRLSRKVWEVFVTYGPPVLFNFAQVGWNVSISSSLTTEQRLFDLDNRPIGSPAYNPVKTASDIVGKDLFNAKLPDGGNVLLAVDRPPRDSDGNITNDDRPFFTEPTTRTVDGGLVTLTRLIPNFSNSVSGGAFSIINKVNNDSVRIIVSSSIAGGFVNTDPLTLAPPFTMKMVGATINPQPGRLLGQLVPGEIWRVTFTMEFNPGGWWHNITMTYKEAGPAVPVKTEDGDLVQERFRMYDSTSFSRFLWRFR